jgi:hypothetical protein
MNPATIAVYHAVERYSNCHTGKTWVGSAKIAEVLNVSQRTVQRSLKTLEDFKLIRITDTPTLRIYYVLPVPPRPKMGATPLFDELDEEELSLEFNSVVSTPPASRGSSPVSSIATLTSPTTSSRSRGATALSCGSDTDDTAYKEEQDLLNKTNEQDLFNKINEPENFDVKNSAQRILNILKLPDTSMAAAAAAVEERARRTKLSMDGIVQDIVTAANQADRRGIEKHKFLEEFLAEKAAERIVEDLHLPATNNLITTVRAAVKAEVTYTGFPVEKVAPLIISAAVADMRRGLSIDRFYFESVKWRSNAKVSKAEQRKLDNLEVNAKVKQRLRERLGAS